MFTLWCSSKSNNRSIKPPYDGVYIAGPSPNPPNLDAQAPSLESDLSSLEEPLCSALLSLYHHQGRQGLNPNRDLAKVSLCVWSNIVGQSTSDETIPAKIRQLLPNASFKCRANHRLNASFNCPDTLTDEEGHSRRLHYWDKGALDQGGHGQTSARTVSRTSVTVNKQFRGRCLISYTLSFTFSFSS